MYKVNDTVRAVIRTTNNGSRETGQYIVIGTLIRSIGYNGHTRWVLLSHSGQQYEGVLESDMSNIGPLPKWRASCD